MGVTPSQCLLPTVQPYLGRLCMGLEVSFMHHMVGVMCKLLC
jgi:hypothetical protein